SSAESKWQRMNGLVMLLPHGYEGQGPEHSSAKPERFLQLCAEYNMIVANLTTAANFFHLLRQQVAWVLRKPCGVLSPKSWRRHPQVGLTIEDVPKGRFHEVRDATTVDAKKARRVVLCTGKVYYDLLEYRQKKKITDVALVRLEQLYPFPEKKVRAILDKYKTDDRMWVQEEPANMGYVSYIHRMMPNDKLKIVSRKASASPATGFAKVHRVEQEKIVAKAFED